MIVAGTGHRPNKLGGYGKAAEQKLLEVAFHAIQHTAPSTVISGMALGWDQALAASAIALGIPLIAAVPFAGQESAWPESSQRTYRTILERAAEVKIVCSGEYDPLKMQLRNEWMVDRCDVVLALWDGSTGGTANCLQYARRRERTIINMYDHFNAWELL